jgi:hypothetical protein
MLAVAGGRDAPADPQVHTHLFCRTDADHNSVLIVLDLEHTCDAAMSL